MAGSPVTIEWLAEHVVKPLGRIEGTVAAHAVSLTEHKREDATQFESLGQQLATITTAQAVAEAAGKQAGQDAGKQAGARSGRWTAASVAGGMFFLFEVMRNLWSLAHASVP